MSGWVEDSAGAEPGPRLDHFDDQPAGDAGAGHASQAAGEIGPLVTATAHPGHHPFGPAGHAGRWAFVRSGTAPIESAWGWLHAARTGPGGPDRRETAPSSSPTHGGRRGFLASRGEVELAKTSQTALITGAGSGIGRAIAEGLDRIGAARRPGRARPREAGADADGLSESGKAGGDARDLRRRRSGRRRRHRRSVLEAFGAIDVLVCNAGTNVRNRSLETLAPDDWDRMIATNLTGAFNLVHAVLPAMRARKNGLVVQICSISGKRASMLGGAGYSASKFGQAALGLCLGREEGPHGIRSTVIYPGEVNTPILDARPVPVAPGAPRRRSSSRRTSPRPSASSSSSTPGPHPRAGHQADRRRLLIEVGSTGQSRRDRRSPALWHRLTSGVHLPGLDLAGGELVELDVQDVAEELALGLELARGADLLDPAVVQDDDLVARPDRREPVGEDDQRAALGEPAERVVDQEP